MLRWVVCELGILEHWSGLSGWPNRAFGLWLRAFASASGVGRSRDGPLSRRRLPGRNDESGQSTWQNPLVALVKLTALSTFSGMGGMDLGLEQAGFEAVGCVESDPVAQRTLKANRSSWRIFEPGSIEEVAADICPPDLGLQTGELDLLVGGPPCQPYSKAAMWNRKSWNGFEDERAKPILPLMELVGRFRPRAVLLENVVGFMSGPHSVRDLLEERFQAINARIGSKYTLEWRTLDAAHFGVAQHRKRAIVVALRDGAAMRWPEPSHKTEPTRAWDALADIQEDGPLPMASGKWAALLPSIPEGQNYLFHTARGSGEPMFGYRTRYWSFLLKLSKQRPSWTLPAQPGPSTGPFHWDSRPLSVKEMLRLQSFPADWVIEGSRREQVRQIGNATPPLLAEILGRSLRATLFGDSFTEAPALAIPRLASVPPARRRASVPRQYAHLISEWPDHPGEGRGPRPRQSPSD